MNPDSSSADSVPVIAAVVERSGRFLVARRPMGKSHGGLWEFPGGKLLDGEGLLAAARRELGEELGVDVASVGAERFRARDPGSPFMVLFVEVSVRGEPRALEHSRLAWRTPGELASMELAPADARFVRESLFPGD